MKKKFNLLIFIYIVFFVSSKLICAYTVTGNNNPGSAYTESSSSTTSGTYWTAPYLQAVRVRIFNGSNVVKSDYYSLATSESECYSSIKNVQLCETSSYNYDKVNNTKGVSCSSKNLSLGCIVGTNLNKSMYWSNGVKANGTYLDDYLKSSNYNNLKLLLSEMGYNNTNFNENDIIIIEPVTLVMCNNKRYVGTSTALMKKNVSYRGGSGNVCSGNDRADGDSFRNVYRNISKAFKNTTSTDFTNTTYKGFGFFKYKVSDLGLVKKGELIIEKIDNHNTKVQGAKFNIYKGNGCAGKIIQSKEVPGRLSLSLSPGKYSIKEISNDTKNYEQPDGTCVNVTIESAQSTTKTFVNKLSCDGELAYINKNFSGDARKRELIKLYNKDKNKNGLLNFEKPSCSNISCDSKITVGCLSGIFNPTDISANNLSCHTNTITVGTDTAFCKTTLNVSSAVSNGPFSAKSGQMYIVSSTGKAITLTLGMKCYLYADSLNSTITGENFSYYLSNVQFDGSKTNPKYLTRGSNPLIILNNKSSTKEYTGSYNVDYYFKKIYTSNGTGKTIEANKDNLAPCTNCKFLGYGKISKLTDKFTNKNIPFKFTLKLKTNQEFSGSCSATVTPEIIIKDKPRIVFRTVNTTSGTPFLNPDGSERESGSNWNGYESIITTNNDSYNKNGSSSPKYKIMLTPTTIQAIRNYNKEQNNNYSDYNLTCKPTSVDSNGEPLGTVCISNYLTTLKTKYGLEINNSKIRACFEGKNKTSLTCSIE